MPPGKARLALKTGSAERLPRPEGALAPNRPCRHPRHGLSLPAAGGGPVDTPDGQGTVNRAGFVGGCAIRRGPTPTQHSSLPGWRRAGTPPLEMPQVAPKPIERQHRTTSTFRRFASANSRLPIESGSRLPFSSMTVPKKPAAPRKTVRKHPTKRQARNMQWALYDIGHMYAEAKGLKQSIHSIMALLILKLSAAVKTRSTCSGHDVFPKLTLAAYGTKTSSASCRAFTTFRRTPFRHCGSDATTVHIRSRPWRPGRTSTIISTPYMGSSRNSRSRNATPTAVENDSLTSRTLPGLASVAVVGLR